jgi:hypothetical protein
MPEVRRSPRPPLQARSHHVDEPEDWPAVVLLCPLSTGRATNDPPWPQGLLPSKCNKAGDEALDDG